jgi:hypothetical protein
MSFPASDWMTRYAAVVNEDAELRLVGRFFTCDVLLDFESVRYLVRMDGGRIREVVENPGYDRPWAFALRAPARVWERYLEPVPPPLHHHIFAMLMRVPEFRLEGDTLVAAQNVRALARMCDLMRVVADGAQHA